MLNYGIIESDGERDCFSSHIRIDFQKQLFRKEKMELMKLHGINIPDDGSIDFTFRGSTVQAAKKHFPGKQSGFSRK